MSQNSTYDFKIRFYNVKINQGSSFEQAISEAKIFENLLPNMAWKTFCSCDIDTVVIII